MSAGSPRTTHDPDGLNGAGPLTAIAAFDVTPLPAFFTRSHAPVPQIDPATWQVEISGLVEHPRTMTLRDLRELPEHTVPATLLCAGLRRHELLTLGPLPGELPWGPEAASTAQWTGVRLRDVLATVGVRPDASFVEFIGLDAVTRHGATFGFGGSITMEKALDPDVLLATGMNGAPLRAEHGAPVRALVPGWIGARSVKWLGAIHVTAAPSQNYFQTHAYRIETSPPADRPTDVTGGVAISTITLNSAILDPSPGATVAAGPVLMRGWAIGGGGAPITRVECSVDDGEFWLDAELLTSGDAWTWTRWQCAVRLPPGSHRLVVRATDAAGGTQPAHLRDVWNAKGYCNSAWHRVPVTAQ